MRLIILLALAITLHAQDKPLATVEELTKQVAEQQKEIAAKDQQNANLQRLLVESQRDTMAYRASLNACMDHLPQRPMEKK